MKRKGWKTKLPNKSFGSMSSTCIDASVFTLSIRKKWDKMVSVVFKANMHLEHYQATITKVMDTMFAPSLFVYM